MKLEKKFAGLHGARHVVGCLHGTCYMYTFVKCRKQQVMEERAVFTK
jgi:hypothetical protein